MCLLQTGLPWIRVAVFRKKQTAKVLTVILDLFQACHADLRGSLYRQQDFPQCCGTGSERSPGMCLFWVWLYNLREAGET